MHVAAAVGLIRLKAHADLGAVLADAFTAELHGAGHGHGQAEEDAGRLAFEGVGRVVFDGCVHAGNHRIGMTQSTRAPVDLTTVAQRVISLSICACSASGVEPTGS